MLVVLVVVIAIDLSAFAAIVLGFSSLNCTVRTPGFGCDNDGCDYDYKDDYEHDYEHEHETFARDFRTIYAWKSRIACATRSMDSIGNSAYIGNDSTSSHAFSASGNAPRV